MPTYPQTKKIDQVDDYHGTLVADPYRWLEDLDSDETKEWVEAQNAVTMPYLRALPLRETLRARLTELWDYEKFGPPFKGGPNYFYFRNDGLQNQFVLYTLRALDEEARVLLDPNTWSDDGTVAMVALAPSDDGRLLAYGTAASGSDWNEWHVVDVASGEETGDHLKWIKFSGAAWTKDNAGFFYSRYDEPDEFKLETANYFQKLYYHRLGTPQSEDELIYHRPDQKEWGFNAGVSEDGAYLLINVWRGTDPKQGFFYKDLRDPAGEVVELRNRFDAQYMFIGNDDTVFYFATDLDAPRKRIVAIDVTRPEEVREIVAEAEETIADVALKGDTFIVGYLKDARSVVRRFTLDGVPDGEIALPGLGTAVGFGGRRDDPETFFVFTSFIAPPEIHRYDATRNVSTLFRRSSVAFDPDEYESKQVFYDTKDGTRIPLFITHKKGLVLDGSNPTLLYGYGGFAIPMLPAFSLMATTWMERGGVYAVACLRGGSEYGEDWHQAGCKQNKQNVFDDFIAAAEWLTANDYTSSPKLAISGGSNGGLLTGACLTQRPDLFGAVHIAVGVLDMLRFHKFTIGWGWASDYGCADDPEDFKYLYAYSPLHNIRAGTAYPPTLLTTADHDDRVVPSHSFKFISTLQEAQAGEAPVLIRIDVKAGHGMGKPTAKIIEETADQLAFLFHALGND